jgi:hypothetical protein
LFRSALIAAALALIATTAWAQVTPAAGYRPPDDTPSIKVGATIFTDFTYTQAPETQDADGNAINPSSFNATRSYINVTGKINHMVSFRITPDVSRETGSSSALNGSLVFRLKYAFAQVGFDDWMAKGSWARVGIQQTPLIDYEEGIYRYRFQGTTFTEREGFLTSSDGGASFHVNFPSNYGEVHLGYYNGDGYSKLEPNDQHAIQIRATVRPFATGAPVLRGLRVTGFYDGDNYIRSGEKKRAVGQVTFEHRFVNAGVDCLHSDDQTSGRLGTPDLSGDGYSVWLTPRTPIGIEGLLRYDHFKPNSAFDRQLHARTIVGVAYWFPHQGSVSTAFLLDYDDADFDNFSPTQPAQKKMAVHALVNF